MRVVLDQPILAWFADTAADGQRSPRSELANVSLQRDNRAGVAKEERGAKGAQVEYFAMMPKVVEDE